MLKLFTNKLFYKKYVYKLRVKTRLATLFREMNLTFAKKQLDEMQRSAEADLPIEIPGRWGIRNCPTVSLDDFMDACVIYVALQNNRKNVMLRCEGNTLDVNPGDFLEEESIQLLINGTPYPVINGSTSSDAYMTTKESVYYGDYKDPNNIGKWKVPEYRNRIHEMYTKYVPYMKSGSYMAIIIKDPTNNKKPFNLHKMIVDNILEHNSNLEYHGFFVHLHTPPTMFMRTYEKRYGIVPPQHQTGIVLRKN